MASHLAMNTGADGFRACVREHVLLEVALLVEALVAARASEGLDVRVDEQVRRQTRCALQPLAAHHAGGALHARRHAL